MDCVSGRLTRDAVVVQLAAVLNVMPLMMKQSAATNGLCRNVIWLMTKRLQWNTDNVREQVRLFYLGMHELYRTDSKKWTIEGGEKNYRRRRLPSSSVGCWFEMRLRQKE
jgi:hypothetical protein